MDHETRTRQMSPGFMDARLREAGFTGRLSKEREEQAGRRLVALAGKERRLRESDTGCQTVASPASGHGSSLRESGGDPFLRDGYRDREEGYREREDGLFDLEFDGIPTVEGPRKLSGEEIGREAEMGDAMEERLREAEAGGELLDLTRDGIPMREATYGGNGTPEVFYEDGNTWQDVTDLYSVLDQERENGTPSLENGQVEGLAQAMQGGHPLSDVQIGVLRRLMDKYRTQIEALRASPDREGQDYLNVPDPATARIVKESAVQLDLSEDGIPLRDAAMQTLDLPRTPVKRSSRFRVGTQPFSDGITDTMLAEDGIPMKAAA